MADPSPFIAAIAMPLLLTGFLMPAMQARMSVDGVNQANGSALLVPGLSVMFAFVSLSMVGTLFFREHAWGTWDRLRASAATTLDLLIGKVTPHFCALCAQVGLFFAIGALLFHYRINGSILALIIIIALFAAMIVAFGTMLVAIFSSMDQAVVLGNVVGFLLAGVGGALAPTSSMPGWTQTIAPYTPVYWTLRGMHDITLNRAGIADVGRPILVMAGCTVIFATIAVLRFRPSDTKQGTT
jgi:ABC-2 type transport system permease protein